MSLLQIFIRYQFFNDDDNCGHQEEIANALKDVLASIRMSERGVYVQASTLGSLEALLEFLRTSKIPVSLVHIFCFVYFFILSQYMMMMNFVCIFFVISNIDSTR